MMISPKDLRVLLLHGTNKGPKIAQIGNWTGKAIYSPIENVGEILARTEFERPGVYILKFSPKKNVYNERIYIGESGDLRQRLKSQITTRRDDPFESLIAFTSTDDLLDLGKIKYLEHKLILTAHENKTSEIENKVSPRNPPISEANVHVMDSFLREMNVILPMLGYDFTTPSVRKEKQELIQQASRDLFKLKDPHLHAVMFVEDGAFVVSKGSQARKTTSKSISKGRIKFRNRLIAEGILIDHGKFFELTKDTIFPSLSAASSVMLGRQSSGPIYWIHLTQNITYAQFLQLQAK